MNIHDHDGIQAFLEEIGLSRAPDKELDEPRYNVAPGSRLRGVLCPESEEGRGAPTVSAMTWGVIPPWARAASYNKPLINARAETAYQKRSFKKLVTNQRTVIPVNGFYEWHREDGVLSLIHI